MPTNPTTLGLAPSFGFGDRLGLATPGHVESLRRARTSILPIFAQQSIREMTRTNRSPREVMTDAQNGASAAGYSGPCGADADHLKTPQDVDRTAEAGFVFFTIDPSGFVDERADDYSPADLKSRAEDLLDECSWVTNYIGQSIRLKTGTVLTLDDQACQRACVKYGRAVNHACELSDYIARVAAERRQPFEIELSVDETPQPTTLAEHYIVAHRCLQRNMKLVSLAPRYVGDFEKGVDYKGDLNAFDRSLSDHAAIAEMLGPYKLSLHSGSDKLSIYPSFARITRGRFHVKTAGTSYLEALRVAARHDEELFRRIIDFSRARYETDKATYHVSATLENTPPPSDVSDVRRLESIYLELWDDVPSGKGFTASGRQILHTTFGSVLTDQTLGAELRDLLKSHQATYTEILADHFARHLQALARGM